MSNETGGGGGPLSGLRVVDATDRLGAYASRLLGDLGADVIRVQAAAQLDDGRPPPLDLHGTFMNTGKRLMPLDLEVDAGRAVFDQLLSVSDALIESFDPAWADEHHLDPDSIRRRHPRLVHASVTPYGRTQTGGRVDADDLTLLAAGGLLHLGGYPEAEPTAAYGQQSTMAASLFAAVGTLVALLDREVTGSGRWIDVSAQECVAQAVEDSVATYDLTGHVRQRLGSEPREAGSGIYPCADGYVTMVAGRLGTAKAWQALVAWMNELGVAGAAELTAPEWSTLTHRQRPESILRFGEIFGAFIANRTRLEMYRESQRRGIALSPVNDIAAVLEDPQLAARDFFVDVDDPELGHRLTYPGPPYRLSATPASPARPSCPVGRDIHELLEEAPGSDGASVAGTRGGVAG